MKQTGFLLGGVMFLLASPLWAEDCNIYAPGVTRNNCLAREANELRWQHSESYRRMQQWAEQIRDREIHDRPPSASVTATPSYGTEAQIRDQLQAILESQRREEVLKPLRAAFAQARQTHQHEAQQFASRQDNLTPLDFDRITNLALPEPDETYQWSVRGYEKFPDQFRFRMALAQTLFCPKASYAMVVIDGQSQHGRAGRSCQALFQPAYAELLNKNNFRQGDTLNRVLNCGVLRFYQGQADGLSWTQSMVSGGRLGLIDNRNAFNTEKLLLEAIDRCESGLGDTLPKVKATYLKMMWELGRAIGDRDVSAAKVWLLSSPAFWQSRTAPLLAGDVMAVQSAVCEAETQLATLRHAYMETSAQ